MSIFTHIPVKKPRRTAFNLSHNYKMTGEMGVLYPIFCQDVVPGDTFKLNSEVFCRLLPMIAPLMSRVRIYTHFFFVPKRLVWDGWQEFITGASQSKSRKDIDAFVPPSYPRWGVSNSAVDASTGKLPIPFESGDLADYLCFPVFDKNDQDTRFSFFKNNGTNGLLIDLLPFRAYQLIWNEYYRDENLQDEIDINSGESGYNLVDTSEGKKVDYLRSLMTLRRRSWKKDYFTSALPFAQAGPDVTLPLAGYTGDDDLMVDYLPGLATSNVVQALRNSHGSYIDYKIYEGEELDRDVTRSQGSRGGFRSASRLQTPSSSSGLQESLNLDVPRNNDGDSLYGVPASELREVLGSLGSATINELRRAFAAQRFLEASARGGSRYIEQLYSIFGVRSSDARLQRPEYLGGSVQDIVVSDVLQTSATGAGDTPQANQAGIGASLGRSGGFKRWFEEHGYVIGILSVLPDASYQQGVPRQYMKFDRFDHYWPQFAHLGEQEIKQAELFYSGAPLRPTVAPDFESNPTFGYTPRYAEYKFIPSTVHGDFRDNLSFWHLGRIFNRPPGLNASFIAAEPRKDVFAVSGVDSTHHFLFNIQHHFKANRPMPRFGTPRP